MEEVRRRWRDEGMKKCVIEERDRTICHSREGGIKTEEERIHMEYRIFHSRERN